MNKVRIYLASQIFAECWRDFNLKLVNAIHEKYEYLIQQGLIDLYVPQLNKSINDKTKCASAEDICKGDFDNNLEHDDIVIAVVDGDTPGIGTTLEIGYFSRICQEEIQRQGYTNKKIISLYTDTREGSQTWSEEKNEKLKEFAESQYPYINLLLVGCLKRYGTMNKSIDQVLDCLDNALKPYGLEG